MGLLHRELLQAVRTGNVERAKELIAAGADVNESPDGAEDNALMLSIRRSLPEMVECLLSCGADPSRSFSSSETPLISAITVSTRKARKEITELLVKHGARVHAPQPTDHDPLHYALSNNGRLDLVEILVNAGADPHAPLKLENSSLSTVFLALPHPETVKYLIEQGADLTGRDKHNRTPLMAAAAENRLESLQLLIEAGADLEACDTQHFTALHWAIYKGSDICLKALIDAGCDPTAFKNLEYTPLMLAAAHERHKCVEVLLGERVDVNARGGCGRTALHDAAERLEGAACLELLLRAGADIKAQDRSGRTAMDLAREPEPIPENVALLEYWQLQPQKVTAIQTENRRRPGRL